MQIFRGFVNGADAVITQFLFLASRETELLAQHFCVLGPQPFRGLNGRSQIAYDLIHTLPNSYEFARGGNVVNPLQNIEDLFSNAALSGRHNLDEIIVNEGR